MKKILFLFAVLSVLSVPALAEVKRHAGLERYEKEGGKVEFLGNAYGLDAWMLVTKDGSPRYVYTTDQGAMVMGALVGPDGDVLSGDMLKAYLKKVEGGQGALPGADKPISPRSSACMPKSKKPTGCASAMKTRRMFMCLSMLTAIIAATTGKIWVAR